MIDLRELGPGDEESLLRIYSAESTQYLGRAPMDADEARYRLRDIMAAAAQSPRTLYVLGLAVDGDLLGIVKLHHDRPLAAVSYILRADAWGRGYATEGVRRLLALAFDHLGLPEVRAKHSPDNPASGRVLRKAGFALTGERNGFMTYAIRVPAQTGRPSAPPARPEPAVERALLEHVIKLADTALDVGDVPALAAAPRAMELSAPPG
ncbi:GNAT family N-acetyltransferase [Kitasatospora sp. NPDC058184]|uniref:GNAT family N-acetyltransferase n=1 Tax=Kitasatospora sp. NPDC058184 TaxID=3346370 RepID=UPI0036DD4298